MSDWAKSMNHVIVKYLTQDYQYQLTSESRDWTPSDWAILREAFQVVRRRVNARKALEWTGARKPQKKKVKKKPAKKAKKRRVR